VELQHATVCTNKHGNLETELERTEEGKCEQASSLAKVVQASSGRARTNTLSLPIPSAFPLSSENALFQPLAICWSQWVKLDQNISMKTNHFYVPKITLNNPAAEVS